MSVCSSLLVQMCGGVHESVVIRVCADSKTMIGEFVQLCKCNFVRIFVSVIVSVYMNVDASVCMVTDGSICK